MTRRHASGRRRIEVGGRFEGRDASEALFHVDPAWACDPEGGEVEALRDEVRGVVERALTGRQRQVVELYFFEGRSQGEIAAELGVSQQVVYKCLHGTVRGGRVIGGAMARLRAALLPCWQRSSDRAGTRAEAGRGEGPLDGAP